MIKYDDVGNERLGAMIEACGFDAELKKYLVTRVGF
ncbi:MAG: hypothetical protein ACI959_001657 [Limisphaerales bacterium]|jgi:hypothetical protein